MILQVSMQSQQPIYEQLRNQIVQGIASGQITQDECLPSVRRLAADLGINHHTVNKSYAMLRDEGYLIMDKRRGAVVSMPSGKNFIEILSEKLSLAAAEAVCHNINETEFIALCSQQYKNAQH